MTLTVNGEEIPGPDIEREMDRLRSDYERYVAGQSADPDEDQLREWSRENLIERILLRQAAAAAEIEIDDKEIDSELEELKDRIPEEMSEEEFRGELVVGKRVEIMVKRLTDEIAAPADNEVSKYYRENRSDFTAPEQVHARHIVKHVSGETDRTDAYLSIMNVKEDLNKGVPFEELAMRNSDCPENAGDLGCFARGQMVQEFEDVVFNMNADEVSDVFESPFGYHIAKVHERRPGGPIPLEDVKEGISQHLLRTKQNEAVEEFVDGLKKKASISG
jgi:parvulin-like peptidyl-prolyl isomerase